VAFNKGQLEFKDYQKEGARWAFSQRYSLNGDEPGLGKTRQALGAIILAKVPAIIVAPAYLQESWKAEIALSGLELGKDVLLLTYHQAKSWRTLPWHKFLFLVVDESHAYKNLEAQRTEEMVTWIEQWRPKYLLLMTGTPIKNNIPELFVPLFLKSLDKDAKMKITDKYPSFFTFAMNFSNIVNKGRGSTFSGSKNIPELKTYLKDFMIRRRAEEVLELPDEIDHDILVNYPESDILWEIFTAFKGETSPEIQLKMESASSKAPFTAGYVSSLYVQVDAPIIVFSDHKTPLEIIESELDLPSSVKVGVITGAKTKSARDRAIADFKRGDTRILLCTIGAAKEGLTLVQANNMVINDLSWVPADNTQVRARIRRIGQTKKCIYHNILGSNIDQKIARMIRDKMNVIKKVL
jgi:SNF2 family DNA or RNA helicase